MDLLGEEYEVREKIIDIMSEILPVYDDCLTIYHKSLLDWLKLDGYEEHAFAADISDGSKRLWRVCKSFYSDILTLKSVSNFHISSETQFSLKYGAKYLMNVGNTDDFDMLVHIRINFLKLKLFGRLGIDFADILKMYKSELPENLYWRMIQHHALQSKYLRHATLERACYIYLQSLANRYFDFALDSIDCQKYAKSILDETKAIWTEEEKNKDISYNIISNAFFEHMLDNIGISPDNNMLTCIFGRSIQVFKLPSLKMIFELEVSEEQKSSKVPTFAPDSSYFLINSVRTCISVTEQTKLPFILNGPEQILSCSFSSCGMKLVTSEERFLKLWDVKRKVLLRFKEVYNIEYCLFSNCDKYIFSKKSDDDGFITLKTKTLKKVKHTDNIFWSSNDFKLTVPSFSGAETSDFFLRSNNKFLSSKPFLWKERKCVAFSSSSNNALVVFDIINNEVLDVFEIACLPSNTTIHCLSKLEDSNFVIYLDFGLILLIGSPLRIAPFVNNAVVKCCTVSPDNLYVACFYKSRTLEIKNSDNWQTLQTLLLQQTPMACWWSELCLWVVCEGVILKFPRDSEGKNILGDHCEESSISFSNVLYFAQGILIVTRGFRNISILRICDGLLIPEQVIPNVDFLTAAVSSDGRAVLTYRRKIGHGQLWEATGRNEWKLHFEGHFEFSRFIPADSIILTGTTKSRRAISLQMYRNDFKKLYMCSFDFSTGEQRWISINIPFLEILDLTYVAPDLLIVLTKSWLHFVRESDAKIVATFFLGLDNLKVKVSFYNVSRAELFLVVGNVIRRFKIHNVEKCLKS